MNNEDLSKIIIIIGAALLGATVVIAILILIGIITPNIFLPTGNLLDVNPLSSGLLTFFMLLILLYSSTRILDFGLKYSKKPNHEKKKSE